MKRKQMKSRKVSAGTLLAAQTRSEGNTWSGVEREKLGEQFMKFYYCSKIRPASTGRRFE